MLRENILSDTLVEEEISLEINQDIRIQPSDKKFSHNSDSFSITGLISRRETDEDELDRQEKIDEIMHLEFSKNFSSLKISPHR